MPMHEIAQSKLAKMHALRWRPMQTPAAQLIFRKIDRGHRPDHDIVQRYRNRSCNLVATADPRHADR